MHRSLIDKISAALNALLNIENSLSGANSPLPPWKGMTEHKHRNQSCDQSSFIITRTHHTKNKNQKMLELPALEGFSLY